MNPMFFIELLVWATMFSFLSKAIFKMTIGRPAEYEPVQNKIRSDSSTTKCLVAALVCFQVLDHLK